MAFISSNPFTGKVIEKFSYISDEELYQKIRLSQDIYYGYWSKLTVAQRVEKIKGLSQLLRDNDEKYGKIITSEMGKPLKESIGEVNKVAWLIDYYVENAVDFLKPKVIKAGYGKSYLRYDPLGGILGIMPWNYPFWQVYRFAIPTMLAGNTVFLKHAPNVPVCGLEIEKTFDDVLKIKGVFQNLFIDIPQVEKVLEHRFVQGVSLTGSDRAGKSVGAIAGKNIKKSVLELGGNDPFILCKDADMDEAIEQFVVARMSNNGQICIAAKRMFVHEDIYDLVREKLIKKVSELKIGDPMDADTDITCLARPDLKDNLFVQIETIQSMGASLAYNGGELTENSCAPIIMEMDSSVSYDFDEEVFGPVAVVIKFENDEELLKMANMSKYGLAASIWSSDIARAEILAGKIEVGNVSINKMVTSDPRIPFGGTKQSGYGREMSEEGIKEFVNVKAIVVA